MKSGQTCALLMPGSVGKDNQNSDSVQSITEDYIKHLGQKVMCFEDTTVGAVITRLSVLCSEPYKALDLLFQYGFVEAEEEGKANG